MTLSQRQHLLNAYERSTQEFDVVPGEVEDEKQTFYIYSFRTDKNYVVEVEENVIKTCTCEHHYYRQCICKHMMALQKKHTDLQLDTDLLNS